MTFELTIEQLQLTSMLADLLTNANECRASYDGGPARDAGLWKQLVDLGVIAMSTPESLGGVGGLLIDQVLVAEQLGSSAAAVPFACVSGAAAVLVSLGTEASSALVSSMLIESQAVLCAVSAERGLDLGISAYETSSGWALTGTVDDLWEAAGADVLVVRAQTTTGPAYFRLGCSGILHDQPSLDQGQRLGRVVLQDTPADLLGRPSDEAALNDRVMATVRILVAAQALGAAAKALTLTVAYAKQRTAFGQPIGRFQAIKHAIVDMLVLVENARSAVYNVAWSFDSETMAPREVSMAKAVATENAVKVVHQAIQSHGGIGFTWEYDLHLLLRRAKAAELALGQPDELFAQIGASLVSTPTAVGLGADAAAEVITIDREFRDELTTWLDENLPAGWGTPGFRMPRLGPERREFLIDLQRRFAAGNWVGIHWPREFGGRAATFAQQVMFNTELVSRGVPQMMGHRGLSIVGPTLIEHGTSQQQERFLERIRRGDDLWAGGFSEPEAGSDLASLRTRAVLDGDTLIVNGQKIWTSSAHWCNWIYTLVRTDPTAAKHKGISVVAIPLDTPGVTIRPIRQINGQSSFNEVFFEDVQVPMANLIGPMNEGWRVNRTTLSHEHVTLFIGSQARFSRSLDDIVDLARSRTGKAVNSRRGGDPHLQARIGRAWCSSQLIMINGLRNVANVEAGNAPGAEGSISKVFGQEAEKRLFELAIDIAGPAGLLDRGAEGAAGNGKWLFGYLGARAATIGGGTSEIHKNKIGEGVLGLPRDLWADTDDRA